MKTRCKFSCYSVKHQIYGGKTVSVEAGLGPVYSADLTSENRKFWEATPSGKLELTINNPAAFECFEAGKEYYIDITPAA